MSESNSVSTPERKPVFEVPGTPWFMTEGQIEFLLRGVNGNPSLLDAAGLTLESAVETYGDIKVGSFVIDRIKADLAKARQARKVETMSGEAFTTDPDGQLPFLVRLRMAAAAAGGYLAEMVVEECDLTLAKCKPNSVVKADKLEVSEAISYALSMFDATQTPVPPKPVRENKTAAASNGTGSLTAYPTS